MRRMQGIYLVFSLIVAAGGIARGAVLWHEDFETVPCDAIPAGWLSAGGNSDFGVDCAFACEGDRSLREFGVINGNWAATVASPIDPGLTYLAQFSVEFIVQNGSENILPGPHVLRAQVQIRPGPSWTSPPGHVIFRAEEDGTLKAADRTTVIGSIAHETCHTVRVDYSHNGGQVQFDYWLDEQYAVTVSLPPGPNENELVWFLWECGAGTAWFDDITVESQTEEIPTVSEWGLIVLTLLGMTAGAVILLGRRRRVVNS